MPTRWAALRQLSNLLVAVSVLSQTWGVFRPHAVKPQPVISLTDAGISYQSIIIIFCFWSLAVEVFCRPIIYRHCYLWPREHAILLYERKKVWDRLTERESAVCVCLSVCVREKDIERQTDRYTEKSKRGRLKQRAKTKTTKQIRNESLRFKKIEWNRQVRGLADRQTTERQKRADISIDATPNYSILF